MPCAWPISLSKSKIYINRVFSSRRLYYHGLRIADCNILIQLYTDKIPPIRLLPTFLVLPVAVHVSFFSGSIKPYDTLQNATDVSLFRERNNRRYLHDQTSRGSPKSRRVQFSLLSVDGRPIVGVLVLVVDSF